MASDGEDGGAVGVSGALSADDAAQQLVADSTPLPAGSEPAQAGGPTTLDAEAIDAERVQNAVAFLSHPKARLG